jgi:hypothetical protein
MQLNPWSSIEPRIKPSQISNISTAWQYSVGPYVRCYMYKLCPVQEHLLYNHIPVNICCKVFRCTLIPSLPMRHSARLHSLLSVLRALVYVAHACCYLLLGILLSVSGLYPLDRLSELLIVNIRHLAVFAVYSLFLSLVYNLFRTARISTLKP